MATRRRRSGTKGPAGGRRRGTSRRTGTRTRASPSRAAARDVSLPGPQLRRHERIDEQAALEEADGHQSTLGQGIAAPRTAERVRPVLEAVEGGEDLASATATPEPPPIRAATDLPATRPPPMSQLPEPQDWGDERPELPGAGELAREIAKGALRLGWTLATTPLRIVVAILRR